jgi:hypothetical protein
MMEISGTLSLLNYILHQEKRMYAHQSKEGTTVKLVLSAKGKPSLRDAIYAIDVMKTVEKAVEDFVDGLHAGELDSRTYRRPALSLSHRRFILGDQDEFDRVSPSPFIRDIVLLGGMEGWTGAAVKARLLHDEVTLRTNLMMLSFRLRELDDFGEKPDIREDYEDMLAETLDSLGVYRHAA